LAGSKPHHADWWKVVGLGFVILVNLLGGSLTRFLSRKSNHGEFRHFQRMCLAVGIMQTPVIDNFMGLSDCGTLQISREQIFMPNASNWAFHATP
jgi:hypothetical protein